MTNRLIDTVNAISEDLVPLEVSREEFLAVCAKKRIESISKQYNDNFDRFLSTLEKNEFSGNDLTKIAKSLKRLSDSVCRLYKSMGKDIKYFEKHFRE